MRSVIKIGSRSVGHNHPAYIIAEIGSNHDSDLGKAKELIRACKHAGADAIKLQSFTAQGLLNPLRADGKGGWAEHPAYKVLERLTVPEEWHRELFDYSREVGITFLSAPFDSGRAALLNGLGVQAFKIASGDLTDEPLIKQIASYKKPIILSTGAAYMDEVRRAVEVISRADNYEVGLLHCAALYPPVYEDVNIRAMVTLKKEFRCPVGFSDHTPGSTVPVAAVALGASIIEKHITLDRNAPGPDHPYAMEVEEFKKMVEDIRNIERALGDGIKRPSKHEEEMREPIRRSIFAAVEIKKGARITPEMLKIVRPAIGLAPGMFDEVLEKTAARDIAPDMPVRKEDVCL